MESKGILKDKSCQLFLWLCASCIFSVSAAAGTVSKTNATDWQVDNSSDTRSVTFVSGVDFPVGATVDDVNLTVQFDKAGVNSGCPVDTSTQTTYNQEIIFRLIKGATTVNAVNAGDYSNGTAGLDEATVTFDSDSANPTVLDTNPVTGTFKPISSFDTFDGLLIAGTWTLYAEDTANQDPLCINSFTVTISDGGSADLTIVKTIINDNSGSAVVGNFNLATSAGGLSFGAPSAGVYTSDTLTVTPGTYTLTEDDVIGYNEGSWSCDGGSGLVGTFDNGSITLADGDDVTCSITNNDTPPATGTSTCESEGGTLSGNIFTTADNGTFGISSSTAGGTIAPTAPYAGFFQAETYDAAFPPNDGEYQILNQTPGVGFGSWDHPITDHTTGTTSGRFALSNMSNVLDSLFLQETVTLTANTNYELTVWVYNVCDSPPCDTSHDPRLEFVINDGLYLDTGLIPYTGGWSEQAFIFNSADNTTSLIKLINKQALGTSGNDLAIDDYTIKECTLPNLGDITGTLYLDADGDNTFDAGETRLPANIRVNLYGSDGVLYSHTDTDANGDYEFIDVPIAFNDYSIEVDLSDTDIPSGYSIGTPNPIGGVTVISGSSVDDQDFGFDTGTKLTIIKQVVNDDGGTATVTNFGITTSAGSLTFDGGVGSGATKTYTATTLSVVPGTYTLIENDIAGYAEGSWSCDEGTLVNSAFDNGSLTLAVTEEAICMIVNNDEVSSVDLSITKTVDVEEPVVGTTVTFTLTVTNAAGGGDATAVEAVDIVPAGFTFVTGSMTGGDLQDQSSPSGTGLKWTINSLPAGAAAVVLTFQAVVNPP